MKWIRRLLILAVVAVLLFFFVILPVGGSYLITNSRFRYPEKGPRDPEAVGLPVEQVAFKTADGLNLKGWWSAGNPGLPVIIFCHGLNRSRLELLARAGEAHKRGYGVLLFDFRNHGESDRAHTTLGILETQDVQAASEFVRMKAPQQPQFLWGVSMGAATALLAVRDYGGFAGVISDSAFPSFRETIEHHVRLLFRIPSFPVADMIVWLTGVRMHMNPDSGNVEDAVRKFGNVPVLFIAGGADRRMPPGVAKRLYEANQSPLRKLIVVPGAGHGEAFSTNREQYLEAVFSFVAAVSGTAGEPREVR
jgi:alpha-beta hydrolase superfamily lysophospholipase